MIRPVSGFGVSDGRSLPCLGILETSVSLYSCHRDHKLFPPIKTLVKTNFACDSKRIQFVCTASSRNHRRTPDFSRQSSQGHSRSRSRQNQEKASSSGNANETDFLHSKNGPLLSLSGSPRFQATSTPGPKEREIVALFRKVQAQLRGHAALREEKTMETSPGDGERVTVDSLLKLLRKHTSDQGKKSSSSSDSNEDFILSMPEKNCLFEDTVVNGDNDDDQNPTFFDADAIVEEYVEEPRTVSFNRPASSFQRKSPVPRVKYQSVSLTDTINSSSHLSTSQLQEEKNAILSDAEPNSLGAHAEACEELSQSLDPDEVSDDGEPSLVEDTDLSSLKLSELRVITKSRGIKGYSKLKKAELVELLSKKTG